MKKRLWAVLLCVCIIMQCGVRVCAYDRKEHDEVLEKVLFGDEKYKENHKENRDIYEAVKAIECGSYLCLDQYNGNGKDNLECLKTYGVNGLPSDIGVIDFKGNQHHRQYTHKGWDYKYPLEKGKDKDKANWLIRKKILQSTVERVFDSKKGIVSNLFGKVKSLFSKEEYSKQYDSFCALVYYVHVLGDQIDANEYEEGFFAVPFSKMSGKGDCCIVEELEKHLDILFESQKESTEYINFKNGMEEIRIKAEQCYARAGGLYIPENFEAYRECECEFLKLLEDNIPELLENEEFFKKVFYQ